MKLKQSLHTPKENGNAQVKSASEYHCQACNKTFKKFIIFEGHFAFNAKCRSKQKCFLQCYVCEKEFGHLAYLKYHLRRQHATNITNQKHPESTELISNDNARDNVEMESHQQSGYKCIMCSVSFETNNSLVQHLQQHFRNIVKQNNETSLNNASANADNTNNMDNENSPMKSRKKIKSHECKLCSSLFSSPSQLGEHHVNIHVNGKFKCTICSIQFTSAALLSHERRFHPQLIKEKLMAKELSKKHAVEEKQRLLEALRVERRHCKMCTIVCSNKNKLDEHMKVHTEGDLECEICKIPFTKNSLAYHEKRMHPELAAQKKLMSESFSKKHVDGDRRKTLDAVKLKNAKICQICKAVRYDAKSLDAHMKVHTEGKFECEICKIPFTKKALIHHRRNVHEDDMIKNRTLLAIERCNSTKRNIHEESQTPSEKSAEIEKIYKRLKATAKSRSNCIICKYTFHDKKSLDRHMSVHIDGKYKCEICPIWFTKDTLIYHERRFHKQLRKDRLLKARETAESEENTPETVSCKFPCDYCQIVSSSSTQKDEHMKVHTEGDLECEICKIPFTKKALMYHLRSVHPDKIRSDHLLQAIKRNPSTNISMYITTNDETSSERQCGICKFVCKDLYALDKHISVHIIGNYQCDLCKIWFTKNTLLFHDKRVHPELPKRQIWKVPEISDTDEQQSNSTTTRIKCEFCKITCIDKYRFDEHMKVHLEGDVECEICKIPLTKAALLYHEKRFHPKLRAEKRFSIAFARNSFRMIKQEEGSNESRENSGNDKANQYQCKICNLFCSTWKHFVTHMKVHTVGEYKCEVCQIWYTKLSLLDHLKRRHPNRKQELFSKAQENFAIFKKNRNTHKSTKKKLTIRCDICKLCFSDKTRLDVHAKVHTGEYECEICKIPYNMRALVKHLGRLHPDQKKDLLFKAVKNNDEISGHINKNGHVVTQRLLKCEICKLLCSGKSNLEIHMKVHIEGDVECEICKIPFTKKALVFHEKRLHPELAKIKLTRKSLENNGSNDGRVMKRLHMKCQLCKVICKGRKTFDRHMMVHTGKFQCEICNVPYTMRSLLWHLDHFHLDQKKELLSKAIENNDSDEKHKIFVNKNGHIKTVRLLKCEICKISCGGKMRLDKHMMVHTEGTFLCEICQITFTKVSLAIHEKRFHPELLKDKNTSAAEKKFKKIDRQYNCDMCDKSFTANKSFKQHIRSHTPNVDDSNEFPDTSSNSSDYGEFTSFICTETTSTSQVDLIKKENETLSFQCYICQKYFQKMNQLKAHLKNHILYQQWIDPLNIHLSNWNILQSREILLNQPLVLVDKLDLNKVDVKSLGQFSEHVRMEIDDEHQVNAFYVINEVQPTAIIQNGNHHCDHMNSVDVMDSHNDPAVKVNMNNENNHQTNTNQIVKLEDMSRPIHTDGIVVNGVIEIDSDSEVETDVVPPVAKIQSKYNHYNQIDKNVNGNGSAMDLNMNSGNNLQTNNHTVKTEQLPRPVYTDVDATCIIDISSDSESDGEALDVFHCYSCNKLCKSLEALSNHKRFCRMSSHF